MGTNYFTDFPIMPLQHGGVGIYIAEDYTYNVIPELSKSTPGVCETLLIEVLSCKKKILLGCLYRHHDEKNCNFTDTALSEILKYIDKKILQLS